MVIYTGREILDPSESNPDFPCIEILCERCKSSVAWCSLRELYGLIREGVPVLCFDCEDKDSNICSQCGRTMQNPGFVISGDRVCPECSPATIVVAFTETVGDNERESA